MVTEVFHSPEMDWFDDIKEGVKKLYDNLFPYNEINDKLNDFMDYIYDNADEKDSDLSINPLKPREKLWKIQFTDKNWVINTISMSTKIYWPAYRRSITIDDWKKIFTINWSWKWNPTESTWTWWTKHFYLTDKHGKITKDDLSIDEVKQVLSKVSWKIIEYQQSRKNEIDELIN